MVGGVRNEGEILRRASECLDKSILSKSGVHIQRLLNIFFFPFENMQIEAGLKGVRAGPWVGGNVQLVECLERVGPEGQEVRALSSRILVSAVRTDESQNYEQAPRESAIQLGKGCECSRLNTSGFRAFFFFFFFWLSLALASYFL